MKTAGARRRLIRRFTLTELMAVAAIVSSVPTAAYLRAKNKAIEIQCLNNMRQVGSAIVAYHLSNGEYPKAAFYPEKPREDANSIRVILADDLRNEQVWVCPAMPDELTKQGLTWIYNDTIGGQATIRDPSQTWVLIEFSCVSSKAPQYAHPGGFNVVYADGRVETTRNLPADITKHQQAMLDALEARWQLTACAGRRQ